MRGLQQSKQIHEAPDKAVVEPCTLQVGVAADAVVTGCLIY